jgi:Tol biopolymer transport system component
LTSELEQGGYFFNIDPVWSPDGNFVAFSASSITAADIMIVEIRDFSTVNITADTDAVFIAPTWLSDSQHVVFTSPDISSSGLWVARREGSGVERIVARYVDMFAGSPVQNILAFAMGDFSATDEGLDIYLVNQDGSSPVDLTQDLVQFENSPAWSPDGSQIAFQALSSSQNHDIWVINADGSGLIQLTTSDSDEVWPIWSPDGRRLTFTSNRDDKADIWAMNADGTNQINLTGKTDCDR